MNAVNLKKITCQSLTWGAAALVTLSYPQASFAGFWKETYAPDQTFIVNLDAAAKNFTDTEKLALTTPASIPDYVQAGITLSDLTCGAWLDTLGRADRDTAFFKDILNIAGNLILGIAGINGVNPSSLAKGSLGLAASNASVDAFRNEIIFGTISDIDEKLKDGRKISAKFFVDHLPKNFHQAKRQLYEYHSTCSPVAIKNLLKAGLAQVKYAPPDTSLATPIDLANSNILADALYRAMYKPGDPGAVGVPSDEAFYRLYVTQLKNPGATTSPLIQNMKADPSVTAMGEAFKKNPDVFGPLLSKIAELRGYAKRLQQELDAEADAAADAKNAADIKAAETAAKVKAKADRDAAVAAKETELAALAAKAEAMGKDVELAAVPTDKTNAEKQSAQTLGNEVNSIMKPANVPFFSSSSFPAFNAIIKQAGDHGAKFAVPAAKDLMVLSEEIKAKTKALEELKATPVVPLVVTVPPTPRTQSAGGSPASISAVIVPIGR